jgi:hypothetical protein
MFQLKIPFCAHSALNKSLFLLRPRTGLIE